MAYLTSQQIVTLACQIAKCPGFLAQGGQFLNMTLEDLWLHRDLKINRKTEFITVQANLYGPFVLPQNYQRTYDLFFRQNNLPYFLNPLLKLRPWHTCARGIPDNAALFCKCAERPKLLCSSPYWWQPRQRWLIFAASIFLKLMIFVLSAGSFMWASPGPWHASHPWNAAPRWVS